MNFQRVNGERDRRWRRGRLTLTLALACLGGGSASAAPAMRTVQEVRCDVDGDGKEDTVRLTVDDKDHSQLVLVSGSKTAGAVEGPSSPSTLEARQVVRDAACELAITSDGLVGLTLVKWRKEGSFKKDHFSVIATFAGEDARAQPTAEKTGEVDVLRPQASAKGVPARLWVWNAERFVFDGPLLQERCDVDGDGKEDLVRIAPAGGAEQHPVQVLDAQGKALASTPPISATGLEVRQVVGDAACEIVVPWRSASSGPLSGQGVEIYKWRSGQLVRVADLRSDQAGAKFRYKPGAKESVAEVVEAKPRKGQLWRWSAEHFAFRLRKGEPQTGMCKADKECRASERCDFSLVEQKKPTRGLCAPIKR